MVNKLSFADSVRLRQSMTKKQKREIARLYEQWAREIGEQAEVFARSPNPSAALQERQARILQTRLRAASDNLSKEIEGIIKENIYLEADSVIKANIKWMQSLGFHGKALNAAFTSIPDKIVRNLVNGNVYKTGWSLSKSIWSSSESNLKLLYSIVAGGRAKNQSIYEISKQLEAFVSPSHKKSWNLTDKDGRRIYPRNIDYNAQRLARTLIQHSYQQSVIEVTQNNPFIDCIIWRSTGSRVCKMCKERDGKRYKISEVPLDHPNGMCVMEPVVDKNLDNKLIAWFNSPDGTYPEIDEFAKNFGYVGENKTTTVKSAKITLPKIDKESLENNLIEYVSGGYSSVKDAVLPDEFKYIESNMKTSSNSFYRLEEMQFTVNKNDLREGSTFSFDDNLRSFTSEKADVKLFLEQAEDWGGYESPVVFQTVDEVKHFDMSPYTQEYIKHNGDQHEHLVGGEMQVVDLEYKIVNKIEVLYAKIKRIN